ncbi:hypothetical protein EPI10_031278 [Gossypium australe]|uniref:Uncharacterized protein n=1 Tax=Gossypium australe TaxID=47621 RepID=A0A5B6X3A0_9ROSI|nr:hypothetical protein EPI10_031278 [Gossypium australe]
MEKYLGDEWYFGRRALLEGGTDSKVAKLIDTNKRIWKRELIANTFSEGDAEKILRIPLAQEPHDDFLVWSGESSGEAYKLLQNSCANPRAYAL